MSPRLFVPLPLAVDAELALPPGPARHAQVRRAQPGDALVLFNGEGGEWSAQVLKMGRNEVCVRVLHHLDVNNELTLDVTIAVGMPANERMDWLVEKATELGVAAIQPLMCERSVLRLSGEREQRKREHWQGIAIAAAEQSGRTRVPRVEAVVGLTAWLARAPQVDHRWLLSLRGSQSMRPSSVQSSAVVLSGPEGGLTNAEEEAALAGGFKPVCLGPRVLRAETAPLAALAALYASLTGSVA